METGSNVLYVDFPNFGNRLLESLNQQRVEGKFCDISIQVQGKVFKAHRAVLAASSPYFHDQVLFRNASRIVLPGVMDARAFEGILASCYAGRLAVPPADIVSYLTVGSFLQMWHVVDRCTELLRECQPPAPPAPVPAPSGQRLCRLTDNQSPSSSSNNYCRPEGEEVTPAKEEGEDEEEEEEEEEDMVDDDNDEEEEEEVEEEEDGDQEAAKAKELEQRVTSNQGTGEVAAGGAPDSPWARPAYLQPSIVPHKRWVHVKKEKPDEGDLVLTCEEDEQHFVKVPGRRRGEPPPLQPQLSISDVCTLAGASAELLAADEPAFDEQIDYCGSSEDFPYEPLDEGVPRAYPGQVPGGQLSSASSSSYHPGGGEAHHGAVQAAAGSPGPGAKLFACHCGKSFTHKSQRDRHINMHLNLRPFGCTICNKKFKMKHHLVEHMKIHTGLKPFECHVCSKKFMWRDSFLRHKAACEKLQRATTANPDIN